MMLAAQLLLCLAVLLHVSHAEVFTALVEMEELLETEAVLIKTMKSYIQAQEDKLKTLKSMSAQYAKQHKNAISDVNNFLSNPVNAYLLTKRMTKDWEKYEAIIKEDVQPTIHEDLAGHQETLKFPTDEDLNGAAVALVRLQETYKLNTSAVARGQLRGVQYSTQMTASDCFELGREMYNMQDYDHTVLWMTEALVRIDKEEVKSACKVTILDYLQFSNFRKGEVRLALKQARQLLTIAPDHERVQANVRHYQNMLDTQDVMKRQAGLPLDDTRDFFLATTNGTTEDMDELTEPVVNDMTCRGDATITKAEAAMLKCRYSTRNHPYLILSPVKEEEAFLQPRILILHDVMTDQEIEIIKRLALPKLRRAGVHNQKAASYRISKNAWLGVDDDPRLDQLDRRIEAITGLTMETAERLQVANYGIGGHYDPHYDFARTEELKLLDGAGAIGNRIATFMFYMSDVAQGGATVFPAIKVAVFPEKGSAVFWYNLHPSGEPDYLTRHAACPVLVGTKWVANKWIHEIGQQNRRPCGATYDHRD